MACGLLGASMSAYFWSQHPEQTSDFSQVWAGARALLAGHNPYQDVGPGRAFDYPWVTPYPLPAFLVALPFAWLPLWIVDPLFTGLSAMGLASVLTRERWNDPRLLVFASFAYLAAAQFSQWSPILTAAVFLPVLSPVLAAKPTISAALWIAYPDRRTLAGAMIVTLLAFAVLPGWVTDWRPTLAGLTHLRSPITFHGGPLLLAALWRWREPEARLLLGLACVPQSAFLYEAVPLCLIPRRVEEAAMLTIGSVAVKIAVELGKPYASYDAGVAAMGQWMMWLLYLPSLVIVLRRR